jgi:hypothetical protein
MIPDLQEDFKSVKTWTNVSVVVGSTHTYQHMFEDGCPIHARLHYGCRYSGSPSPSEFGFEGRRTPPGLGYPVIQIRYRVDPSCLHQGLRILVLSRFRYRVDPSCLTKAFGYSCVIQIPYRVDHLEDPETKSNVRGKCL